MFHEHTIVDAMQYVNRRVEAGRAFSFDQWSSQIESETLNRLGAVSVDFAVADVRPFRAVMALGGIVWFQKGSDVMGGRWQPVRKQYLRLKAPPSHWDLQMGDRERIIFERDGRYIWIADGWNLYKDGKAQWDRLDEIGDEILSAVEGESTTVSKAVVEEVQAALAVSLPSASALKRMNKGALVGLGWQNGISLHMGLKKTDMIARIIGQGGGE